MLASLKKALGELGLKLHETVVVGGIGCSGHIHNNVGCYGVHALHGRALPTAMGLKLANPSLTVIAAGGDGDGYAIGAGHFVHALKRNPSIVYIVMQNGTYGLTKGQPSPTALPGYEGNVEPPFDAVMTALSIQNTSFIARGFSGNQPQLTELIKKGILHANNLKGFAFIEVLSPCVTYNDTYKEWREAVHNLDAESNYDRSNRLLAYTHASEVLSKNKIPTGLVYRGEAKSLEAVTLTSKEPLALQDLAIESNKGRYEEFLADFR